MSEYLNYWPAIFSVFAFRDWHFLYDLYTSKCTLGTKKDNKNEGHKFHGSKILFPI